MRRISMYSGVAVAAVLLVAAGLGYRVAANALDAALRQPILPERPLSELPLRFERWHGGDMRVSSAIQDASQVDDFLTRRYIHEGSGREASLFIGYSARPRTMVGHRPDVCYPAAGWLLDEHAVEQISVGRHTVRVNLHRFRKPTVAGGLVVLSYYVTNGRVTPDDGGFRDFGSRDPNLGRESGRYVAQVQIATPVTTSLEAARHTAREFACATLEEILNRLPRPPAAKE